MAALVGRDREGMQDRTVYVRRPAKRLRVRYALAAEDDVDGLVAVSCKPNSGSWFKLGRTKIRCAASDSSGNEAAAAFVVVVKRRR